LNSEAAFFYSGTTMKKILKICLVCLAFFFIVIAATPTLLSTTTAREFCLSQINKRIPGKISLSTLKTGWTSGLLLQDLEIKDPAGRVVLACEKIELADSIFTLLVSPKKFGHLTILKPTCTLIREKNGDFSILQVMPASPTKEEKKSESASPFIPYFTEAAIEQGSLQVVQDGAQESAIQDLSFHMNLKGLQTADFSLSAAILHNGKEGTIAINGTGTDLRSIKKSYQQILFPDEKRSSIFPTSQVNLTCTFSKFPVSLADSLLTVAKPDLKGFLTNLLGDELDVQIAHHLGQEEFKLNTSIESPTFASKIDLLSKDSSIQLVSPAQLRFQLRPGAFEKLKKLQPRLQHYSLASPSVFEVILLPTHVQLPFVKTSGDLTHFSPLPIELRFGTKSPLLLNTQEVGTLQANITGSIEAISLLDELAAKIRISIGEGADIGMVEVDAQMKTPFSDFAAASITTDLHGAWPALFDRLQLSKDFGFFVGKEIHAHTHLEIPKLHAKPAALHFEGQLTSQAISAATKGSLKGSALKLGATQFSYDLFPAQLQKFTKITLMRPLKTIFALSHLSADCTALDLQNLDFKGTLGIEPFELTNVPMVGSLQSKKAVFAFEQALKSDILLSQEIAITLPSLKEEMKIQGNTAIATKGLKGALHINTIALNNVTGLFSLKVPYALNYNKNELQLEATLSNETKKLLNALITISNLTSGSEPKIASKGTFQELPTELVTLLAPSKTATITGLLGHEVAGSWEVFFSGLKKPQNLIRATIKSPEFQAGINLEMDEKAIEGAGRDSPLWLKMLITNERAKALLTSSKLDHLSLKESTPFECVLKKFALPLSAFEPGSSPTAILDRLHFDAALHIGTLNLFSSRSNTAHALPAIDGSLLLTPGSRTVAFSLENQKNEFATEIKVKAILKDLWSAEQLTPEKSDILLESKLKNVPVDFIQLFTSPSTREKISALSGDSFDATLDAKLTELTTGSLHASVDAERIHSNMTCAVQDGIITLPKPLVIKAIVTKDAGKTLFRDVNPLLATSISTPHPVEVTIDNRNFRIPLKPYLQGGDITQLKRAIYIPSVTLQIGKIRVQKGNTLSTVFSLLGLPDEAESELWLTPIYLQMQNGLITMRRSDTLVDNRLQIASWGTVDLIGDRVDMVIGIPGPSLKAALHLRSIDPNYMLQLPIRGTTSTASLDKTRAVAKIASLRMQQSSSDTQALIGGVLGLMTQASEPAEAPVPAPTTVPFPWQK